jgi:iron complex transport system permease protein
VASEIARKNEIDDEISFGWKLAVFAGFAALALAWAPFWGGSHIPPSALWGDADPASVNILRELRIPRVLMAFLAGAALSAAGMVFQSLFRNPLATPFTLGVSSGAALGASMSIQFGWTFVLFGISSVPFSSFVGAFLSMGLVYAMAVRSRRRFSSSTLLLAGAAVCFSFSCLILFLQYVGDFTRPFQTLRWTMGGLERIVQFRDVLSVFPFIASGCLIVWYLLHELNLLSTGEEFAFSRGVNVRQTKILLLIGVSLMIGAVVAVCGPIGFVGLISPHISRSIVGADHRRLYPAALLFGGGFLVICDTAARTLPTPDELPVGIITALLGGPFYLWLLLARKQDFSAV